MGRKKAGEAEASDENKGAAVKPSETQILIGEKQLKALLTRARTTTAEVGSLVGDLREKIGNAVEKQHLHKGAFAKLRQYDRMVNNGKASAVKEELDTLLAYLDMSGIQKKLDDVQTLNFEPPAEDEETEAGQPSTRRGRFPAPVAEAAE